jgi:hypothetical protein
MPKIIGQHKNSQTDAKIFKHLAKHFSGIHGVPKFCGQKKKFLSFPKLLA